MCSVALCAGLIGLGACGGSADTPGGEGTDAGTIPAVTDRTAVTEPAATDPAATDRAPATDVTPGTDAPPASADDPPPSEPSTTTTVAPADPLDLDDAMLEAAIAQAAADPLVGLPGRSTLATALLAGELAAAGFELAGTELTIYPGASAAPFVLLATDDTSALLADDVDGEEFVVALLDSPVLADNGVERLVLRHSSADDDGPFVVTFTVPLADLRAAADTGADVSERAIAVQVERP